jgi:hypothetical protein
MAQIRYGIPNNISADCRVALPVKRHGFDWGPFNLFFIQPISSDRIASKELQSEIFEWVRKSVSKTVYHVQYENRLRDDETWEFFFASPGDALAFRMRFS